MDRLKQIKEVLGKVRCGGIDQSSTINHLAWAVEEIEGLREKINHSGAVKRKINRDVLEELHEMSGNPDEHYIPPATLAKRAVKAEAKVVCLQAIVDKLPKTRDGVTVLPDMDVWLLDPTPICVWVRAIHATGLIRTTFHGFKRPLIESSQDAYSTREAAEAVKEK